MIVFYAMVLAAIAVAVGYYLIFVMRNDADKLRKESSFSIPATVVLVTHGEAVDTRRAIVTFAAPPIAKVDDEADLFIVPVVDIGSYREGGYAGVDLIVNPAYEGDSEQESGTDLNHGATKISQRIR